MATCGGPVVDTSVNTSSGGFHKALFPMFQPPAYIYIYIYANNIFERKNDGSFPEANQGAEYLLLQTDVSGTTNHQLFLLSLALFTFLLHIAGLIGFPSSHLVMFGKKSKRALCLSRSTSLQRAKLKAPFTTLEVDGASFTEQQCNFDQMATSAVGVGESNNLRKEGAV